MANRQSNGSSCNESSPIEGKLLDKPSKYKQILMRLQLKDELQKRLMYFCFASHTNIDSERAHARLEDMGIVGQSYTNGQLHLPKKVTISACWCGCDGTRSWV